MMSTIGWNSLLKSSCFLATWISS